MVSIIIPIYNVAPYIADCLQSVVNQTYRGEMECLLVDDCGTDNSVALAEEFVARYKGPIHFRILHHEHNRGLSAARNTALAEAKGNYVYFLDSDDELQPHCIERLTACLTTFAYDFVIGGICLKGDRQQTSPLTLTDGTAYRNNAAIRQAYFHEQWYTMACGKLCNRQFLLKNKLFFKEGLLHEDELWSFQLACTAQSMCVVKADTYIYKVREGSITTNGTSAERHARAWTDILTSMVQYVNQNPSLLTPDVTKFILDEAYSFWRLFCWVNLNSKLRHTLTLECQRAIAQLPFSLRWKVCTLRLRYFVRYANALLPSLLADGYYRMLQLNK